MYMTDYVMNGEGFGPVGQQLNAVRFEPGLLRPYLNDHNDRVVTINEGYEYDSEGNKKPKLRTHLVDDLIARGVQSPVFNATALRKDEWIQYDQVLIEVQRKRLQAWADLAGSSSYTLDGMSKTILENEAVNDPGYAMVDMDMLTEGRNDRPLYVRQGLPLPITHCDFFVSKRKLMQSRVTGEGISTLMARVAARRVAETVEQTTIGTLTGLTFGASTEYQNTSKVYGYLTHPDRATKKDLTAPNGTNGDTIVSEWITMREVMYDANFRGPFMVYVSTDWDQYLDMDYYVKATSGMVAPVRTLRDRLKQISGIQDIRRLDYLTASAAGHSFTVIFVQMDPEVCRAVIGMPMQTLQWEEKGGLLLKFKVACINVPQIHSDYSGSCGVLHAYSS